jgi:hypothetical protein
MTTTPIPRPRRSHRGNEVEPRPTMARIRIASPGKSVSSGTLESVSRSGAVADPQTKFSSGATRYAHGGDEYASTSDGERFAFGCASATCT